jgi:hypothetical protein
MSDESDTLEVVVAIDELDDSLGYYMRLPRTDSPKIQETNVVDDDFKFADGFDYGTADHYCGGYGIGGDCPTAGLIFDYFLGANHNKCVEYWGEIIHLGTGISLRHEVYYDYHEGFAGGQIGNTCKLELSDIIHLLKVIADRLVASVGIKSSFQQIRVLPTTSFAAQIEIQGIECFRCGSVFKSFAGYSAHRCKELIELKKMLDKVRSASTNKEKKETLQSLSRRIVEATPGLEISHEDAEGLDGEIDLIVINECRQRTLEEMGTPIVVECRNWEVPMPAKAVRDFGGKIRDRRVETGIIISMKGVTGSEKTDAKLAIRTLLTRDNIKILVFDEDDLEQIVSGIEFHEMLRKKFYEIRTY